MSTSKPQPLFAEVQRPRCPVCGETTYSASGIHPQCAQERSDEEQKERIKIAAAEAEAQAPVEPETRPWHKRCPRCNGEVHARKYECPCGYEFPRSRAKDRD